MYYRRLHNRSHFLSPDTADVKFPINFRKYIDAVSSLIGDVGPKLGFSCFGFNYIERQFIFNGILFGIVLLAFLVPYSLFRTGKISLESWQHIFGVTIMLMYFTYLVGNFTRFFCAP